MRVVPDHIAGDTTTHHLMLELESTVWATGIPLVASTTVQNRYEFDADTSYVRGTGHVQVQATTLLVHLEEGALWNAGAWLPLGENELVLARYP